MKALLRLYPRRRRERYGAEFEALLEDSARGPRQVTDVFGGGLGSPLGGYCADLARDHRRASADAALGLHEEIVGVAPHPVLAALVGGYQRMVCGVVVARGVVIL